MSIYVGNLPYSAGQQDLAKAFKEYGQIVSISLPTSRESNRPRGFAFMDMESSAQEEEAIEALDGVNLMGRTLKVMRARSDRETASKAARRGKWHRCIPFYRRPLFQTEDRFFKA